MSSTRRVAPPVLAPAPPPRKESRHGPIAQFLIALSPLSLILVSYGLGAWITSTVDLSRPQDSANRLGIGVHETAAAHFDGHVFGVVPTVWLQQHLLDGTAHWYDAVCALVYVTHFIGLPVLTAVVWFRIRDRYRAWLAAVISFTAIGVGGYVLFPASPPWLAAQQGDIGPVDRVSGLGWSYLHLADLGRLLGSSQGESNPVAAMPSLHAGAAMLITLFLWPLAGRAGRAALAAYTLTMGFTLVYTGEHYVLDVLAGWATAAVAVGVGAAVQRRVGRRAGVGRAVAGGAASPR